MLSKHDCGRNFNFRNMYPNTRPTVGMVNGPPCPTAGGNRPKTRVMIYCAPSLTMGSRKDEGFLFVCLFQQKTLSLIDLISILEGDQYSEILGVWSSNVERDKKSFCWSKIIEGGWQKCVHNLNLNLCNLLNIIKMLKMLLYQIETVQRAAAQ